MTAPIIRNCTETIPTIAQRCQWQALQPILPAMSADGITAHQNYQFGAGLEDPPTGQGSAAMRAVSIRAVGHAVR